jgi:hypothetical protein
VGRHRKLERPFYWKKQVPITQQPIENPCRIVNGAVCPDCYAVRLVEKGDTLLSCPTCASEWRRDHREPCPDFGVLGLGIRGGESVWMCPSHLVVMYREKAAEADSTQKIQPPNERTYAEHESGHVVTARALGFRVTSVRIEPDPQDANPGTTQIEWGDPPTSPDERRSWCHSIAQVCFAGFYATCGIPGSAEWNIAEQAIYDDYSFLTWMLLKHVTGRSPSRAVFGAMISEVRRDASALVATTSSARIALADLLMAKGRLSESEIIGVVDPLLPSKSGG